MTNAIKIIWLLIKFIFFNHIQTQTIKLFLFSFFNLFVVFQVKLRLYEVYALHLHVHVDVHVHVHRSGVTQDCRRASLLN